MMHGSAPHLQGSDARLASRTARKLFEKSFLDLQKLLKMGVIKPRPSGEVAAQLVALTERAIICKGAMRGSLREGAPDNVG